MPAIRFKLCSFSRAGTQGAGMVIGDDETIYDIAALQELAGSRPIPATIRSIVDDWDASFPKLRELAEWVNANGAAAKSAVVSREGLTILAPIQPPGSSSRRVRIIAAMCGRSNAPHLASFSRDDRKARRHAAHGFAFWEPPAPWTLPAAGRCDGGGNHGPSFCSTPIR